LPDRGYDAIQASRLLSVNSIILDPMGMRRPLPSSADLRPIAKRWNLLAERMGFEPTIRLFNRIPA
jgi:hypothetical protein